MWIHRDHQTGSIRTVPLNPSAQLYHGIPPPNDDLAPKTRPVGPPGSSGSLSPLGSPAPFLSPTGPKRAIEETKDPTEMPPKVSQ